MAFWSKDEQTRITETFDYIASRVPPMERQCVKDFLSHWLTSVFGGAGGTGQRALSEAMSTRHANNVGDKETRAGRRALVILRGDGGMLNTANALSMQPGQIMSMQSGQVVAALNAVLPAFRLFAQQEERVNTGLQIKYNEFISTPQTFLLNNIIVTQSQNVPTGIGAAGAHRFMFSYKDQYFQILPPNMTKPSWMRGDGLPIQAVNVPEMYWFNVPGRGNIPNPPPGSFATIPCTELTGADLMVTSAFTGCSFCFKNNGGAIYAAHVSPDGTAANAGPSIGPAPTLANQIGGPAGTGDFNAPPGAVAGALSVFGRGFSNVVGFPNGYAVNPQPGTPLTAASMYVFGIRQAGIWRVVYQENNAGNKTFGQLV